MLPSKGKPKKCFSIQIALDSGTHFSLKWIYLRQRCRKSIIFEHSLATKRYAKKDVFFDSDRPWQRDSLFIKVIYPWQRHPKVSDLNGPIIEHNLKEYVTCHIWTLKSIIHNHVLHHFRVCWGRKSQSHAKTLGFESSRSLSIWRIFRYRGFSLKSDYHLSRTSRFSQKYFFHDLSRTTT